MALTDVQKSYIRDNSGDDTLDNATVPAYEVSDTTLQAIYDDTAQGNGDLNKTVYYAILRRWGKAARMVGLSGEFGNAQHNQKFEQLERLLKLWGGITGLGGGTVTAGLLHLRLDYSYDDMVADAADSSESINS